MQIAIMARSDVFREARARKLNTTHGPTPLFRIVNQVVATHLAEKPLPLPSLAAVLTEARKSGAP